MMIVTKILGVAIALTLAGCGDSSFSGSSKKRDNPRPLTNNGVPQPGAVTETFTAQANQVGSPVDIIFVVDTSGSMAREKSKLEAQMQVFITQLKSQASRIDYQGAMIGSGFTFPTNPEKFAIVNQKVGSNDALKVAADFLSGRIQSPWRPRPNATKHLVFITDDNGENRRGGIDALQFKAAVSTMNLGQVRVNGFVGLQKGQHPTSRWCNIAKVGSSYQALAQDPQFQGIIQDLCTENWGAMLSTLANQIIQTAGPTNFRVTRSPNLNQPVTIKLGGQVLNGARLNPDGSLVLPQGTQLQPGQQVEVTYFPQ